MTTRDRRGGEAHDAWLAEALRHAPDASDVPPPTLREAILAQARAAAHRAATPASPATAATRRGARATTLGQRLAAGWAALARPPVAAGFATVMVAVLVGVMWQGQPIDEAMPSAPPMQDTAQANPQRRPSAQAPAPAPATATAPPPEPRSAQPFPALTAPSSDKPVAATPTSRATRAEASRPPERAVEAESPRREQQVAAARQRLADDRYAAPSESAPATPSPREKTGADRDAAHASALGPRLAPPAAAPKAATDEAKRAGEPVATLDRDNAAGRVVAQPRSFPGAAPAASAGTAQLRPMAALLRSLATADARWSRVGANGTESAVDAALADWLASVDSAVVGHWQRGSPPTSAGGRGALTIELLRDGRTAATLRIDDDAVAWREADGRAAYAPLGPGVAGPLRAALPTAR